MNTPVICLVTIHGVGFQQAPVPSQNIPGYADMLHEHLAQFLDPALLGDDPQRDRSRRGEAGPVYVQSDWPPETDNSEAGLARLGSWVADRPRAVDVSDLPLVDGDQRIAHVALVYSHLEDQGPHLGVAFETSAKAAFSLGHYASIWGAAQMMVTDFTTLLEHHAPTDSREPSSLQVRVEAVKHMHGVSARVAALPPAAAPLQPSSGLLTVVRQLEADVATYICRNDLRERVRGFVREALLRLIFRDDVAGIVVNAHSQGTVLAFDVLSDLPPFAASKVLGFITAGSPLRKYSDLFSWGYEVGSLGATTPWTNFWDPRDPVADPLAHSRDPRARSARTRNVDQSTRYQWVDPNTGLSVPVPIADPKVNNVDMTVGSGLRAHNYWDNTSEVVGPIADILHHLVTAQSS